MKPLRALRLALLVLLALCGVRAHAAQPVVVVLRIEDTIQPISEDYFKIGRAHV